MDIEELNITNDDGTGLIRTDSDNDVIIGRKNADDKMYLESIIGYDDGKGNDVVGHGYDFRLKLHPGKWKEGKSGTIPWRMKNSRFIVRLTFRWCPKPNLTQLPGNLFSIFIRFGLIIGDIITELTKVWGDWKM